LSNYDALFILPTSLKEEEQEGVYERLREEVTKLNGTVDEVRPLGKRVFARPMKKHDAGFYVRVDMSLPPESVAPLLARLKLNEMIFRVQVVKQEKPVAVVAEPVAVAAEAVKEDEGGES